jgi:hypothetical protein
MVPLLCGVMKYSTGQQWVEKLSDNLHISPAKVKPYITAVNAGGVMALD